MIPDLLNIIFSYINHEVVFDDKLLTFCIIYKNTYKFHDKHANTSLIFATQIGCIKSIKLLSKNNIDTKNNKGKTALIYAVMNNYIVIVKELLKFKPDISIKDNDGFSACEYAQLYHHNEIFGLLMQIY